MKTEASMGMIGLGVMGRHLALNFAGKGLGVAVFDRKLEHMRPFESRPGIVCCASPENLLASLRRPRVVMMMLPAGEAIDGQVASFLDDLEDGDLLIDGGNSHFRDTGRRSDALAKRGIGFLGVGVSGGEMGAREGPSIMAGGPHSAWVRVVGAFEAIAARLDGRACCAWFGSGGAGHFVKTVHNGIEYADMQAIADVYSVLRDGLGSSAAESASVLAAWNDGILSSYLMEIAADILRHVDPALGLPTIDTVVDRARQSGTGRWASEAAAELGIAAPTLAEAVASRSLSMAKAVRLDLAGASGTPARRYGGDRGRLLADCSDALVGTRIAILGQAFSILDAARQAFAWHEMDLASAAFVWQRGAIVRSRILAEIHAALEDDRAPASLLRRPPVVTLLGRAIPGWRRAVAAATMNGWPVPALSSALVWVDGMFTARSTANLIQAQRDYFGRHGVEREGSSDFASLDWGPRIRP